MITQSRSATHTWLLPLPKRIALALCLALGCANSWSQTLSLLRSFAGGDDGLLPDAGLVLSGNTLYGTTSGGGTGHRGTLFRLNTDGSDYRVLTSFDGAGGAYSSTPRANLLLSGPVLFGTSAQGGISDFGTVFRINTDGTGYAVLKDFLGRPDGNGPTGGLVLSGSSLYGTTRAGGPAGYGTVFRINTDGSGYTIIKSFEPTRLNPSTLTYTNSEGAHPDAGLALEGNALYGTAYDGGSSGYGSVFKLNTDGTGYTLLKTFAGAPSDGAFPSGTLLLSDGTLYGTTENGGKGDSGTLFKLSTNGNSYRVLYAFPNTVNGRNPSAALVLSGNTLYGTTESGSSSSSGGAVFKINTDGTGFVVLQGFRVNSNGYDLPGDVILSGNTLYGTTQYGGVHDYGTVFSVLLPPATPPVSLKAELHARNLVLSWNGSGFFLQAASAVTGVFTNVPGAKSPYTNTVSGSQRFFRLISN